MKFLAVDMIVLIEDMAVLVWLHFIWWPWYR